MLLSILAGAAVAAATALAYWLWRKLRKKLEEEMRRQAGEFGDGEQSGEGDSEEGRRSSAAEQAERERRARAEQAKRDELLRSIVRSIDFSTQEMVSDRPLAGTKARQSLVPTRNFSVRPIRGVNEVPAVLPAGQMLDDDQFYGRLATNSLLMGEFQEYYGKARRILCAAFDRSGSMKEHGRAQWARGLCEALVDHCLSQQAEFWLIVFTNRIVGTYRVSDQASAKELKQKLGRILAPDGDTNVNLALDTMFDMIRDGHFAESRGLLVTDGTDAVNEERFRKRRQQEKVFLHTVSIAGDRDDLRRISDRYDQLGMFSETEDD